MTKNELLQLTRLYGIRIELTQIGTMFPRRGDYWWNGTAWVLAPGAFVQETEVKDENLQHQVISSLYSWVRLGTPLPEE